MNPALTLGGPRAGKVHYVKNSKLNALLPFQRCEGEMYAVSQALTL